MKATRLDVANHTTPLSRRRGAGGEAVGEGLGDEALQILGYFHHCPKIDIQGLRYIYW